MIDTLLHAAMAGPSACNTMPWEFYVFTAPEKLAQLRKVTRFSNMNAPLAIVVCGNLKRSLPGSLAPFWVQDCSAATENILLAATDLGLGTVWCGIHPNQMAEKKIREVFPFPDDQIPLNIIYIGHPAEEPEARDQYNAERAHWIE